ncbi:MAG TPA: GAF domain-containing protein, partial [Thermoanaerobaculaceae bacterium]|nr:GAF domain-containing protein [Thermoanaerobaculaceae bacterium]
MLAFWGPEREVRAKELLYRCLEELGATKAAFYLAGNQATFELAASYGFGRRDALSAEIKAGHPLWDWIRRHRTSPSYLNEVKDAPALQLVLTSAGTSRLLTIPLLVGENLVGLVDARDKARRTPFGPEDVPTARAIAAAFEDFLRETGGYGEFSAEEAPKPAPAPAAAPPRRAAEAAGGFPHRQIVEEASAALRTLVPLPGIAAAALNVTDGRAVRVLVLRTVPLDRYQQQALATHQVRALAETGVELPPPTRWSWEEQDSGGGEKRGDEI